MMWNKQLGVYCFAGLGRVVYQYDGTDPVVVIGNTDTGDMEAVNALKPLQRDILGYCSVHGSHYGVAMPKSGALLYRHLKVQRTRKNVITIPSAEMKLFVGSGIGRVAVSHDDWGEKGTVVLVFEDDSVSLRGRFGSVILLRDEVGGQIDYSLFSLYTVFKHICSFSHLDIMQYENILLYSRVTKLLTPLKLSQSKESKRFFLKLYMEMIQDEVRRQY